MKHTKSEWKTENNGDGFTLFTGDTDGYHTMIGEIYLDDGSNGMPDVRTIPPEKEAEANAKLISAAPDLLRLALDFQTAFNERVQMKPEPEHLKWFVEVTRRMTDIIAKATE